MKNKLYLLDAMALIYRAYYALNKNPRINSKGLNTSAILGFANSLFDVISNEKPSHIAVAFDTSAPTVRHIAYPEYKANREKQPEDISAAIPWIIKLIESFNIPVIMLNGYEADDIIGTISKKAEKEDFDVYMMTPDKDYGQLISENIKMHKPPRMGNKKEIWGINEICEKFGIDEPIKVIDYLAMVGDASDNIPGIPGIGDKTAKKFLAEYGSLNGLYENTDKLKGKQKEKVENNKEQAYQSYKLATIILDVPIEINTEEYKIQEVDRAKFTDLCQELELRRFAERVLGQHISTNNNNKSNDSAGDLFGSLEEADAGYKSSYKTIEDIKYNYQLCESAEERQSLITKLNKQDVFCFDTETTGLDTLNDKLVGISFCYNTREAYFVLLPEDDNDCRSILAEFKEVFENNTTVKIGHNIGFDFNMLKQYDITTKGMLFDTMIAHYLLHPDQRHSMDSLALNYFNYETIKLEQLIGKKGANQRSIRTAEKELLVNYACEDADITWQLYQVFASQLKEAKLEEVFYDIESPLIPVLASMHREGVAINSSSLNDFSGELGKEISALTKSIYEDAECEFNIASPKQLGEILFDKMKITDNPKKTKTKQYATGEDVLKKLVKKHPIVEKILEFRTLSKLKNTYIDTLPLLVNKKTNRIHTSYMQAVAATGRLSSTNPNLQNIPIRSEKGKEIRKAFVPRSDEYTLLAADYSQIELRLIADLSKDKGMTEAFKNNIDIHTSTAAKIYKVDIEDVDKDMRRNAKAVNFGIMYGISAFGLSEQLLISRKDAADIINEYFIQFPDIRDFMDKCISDAREKGYVETVFGRKRQLKDINSSNGNVRAYAERNAVNTPIQGSSADIIKIAMIKINKQLEKQNLKSKMILQVHDELIFDVYKPESDIVKDIVSKGMLSAYRSEIPLEIDINFGDNWLEAH